MHRQIADARRRRESFFLLTIVLAAIASLFAVPRIGSVTPPNGADTPACAETPAATSNQLTSITPAEDALKRLQELQNAGAIPPIDTETPAAVEKKAPTLLLNAPIVPERAKAADAATTEPTAARIPNADGKPAKVLPAVPANAAPSPDKPPERPPGKTTAPPNPSTPRRAAIQ